VVDLIPYIPDLKKPVAIRVIVIGHVENAPTELVGAYIDVQLFPEGWTEKDTAERIGVHPET
jgi:hypothetical protein